MLFEYACPSENLLTNSGCFRVDMSKLEVDFPFKFRYIFVFSYEKTIIKQDHVMTMFFGPFRNEYLRLHLKGEQNNTAFQTSQVKWLNLRFSFYFPNKKVS